MPKILRLADEPLGFRLAISLHGATDEVREKIMPVNRAYPLAKLLPAVRAFSERHGRMVTLEFILIDGINDSLDQAARLRDIARDLHAHVNLIPYNTVEGLPWRRPSANRQERFADVLRAARPLRHAAPREGPRDRRGVRPASAENGTGADARGGGLNLLADGAAAPTTELFPVSFVSSAPP